MTEIIAAAGILLLAAVALICLAIWQSGTQSRWDEARDREVERRMNALRMQIEKEQRDSDGE